MAKRKTREQKAIADQRHVLYHLETSAAQVSIPSDQKIKIQLAATQPAYRHQTSYTYVITDLKKTALITTAILFAQLILFFILHRV
ncbi:MAG: hypothetical protein AAB520_02170 [Patescibacteria group bacterium]